MFMTHRDDFAIKPCCGLTANACLDDRALPPPPLMQRGDSSTLEGYKLPFCHSGPEANDLLTAVKLVKPTVLVGLSPQGNPPFKFTHVRMPTLCAPLHLIRTYPMHFVPCHSVQCQAVPCRAMPCRAMPCHVTPYQPSNAMNVPCCAIPWHPVPCYGLPLHAMLCHAMQ
eukprot:358278-Chlamydomonas_euryale.AAC.4